MLRALFGRSTGRLPASLPTTAVRQTASLKQTGRRQQALRARGWGENNSQIPFMPPEIWHEPRDRTDGYRIVVRNPGPGYRHVVTPDEVRARLAMLPEQFVKPLEVVQLSGMTRKKRSLPLYGMQWGTALYLYPIEADLIETFGTPPKPSQQIEAQMYGGRWEQDGPRSWRLIWTEAAVKDFYLNNILMHELGHLLDQRNTRTVERERYAEWFAVEYGYRATQATRQAARAPAARRHG